MGTSDCAELAELWTQPRVREYLGGVLPQEEALKRTASIVARPNTWAVELIEQDKVIGIVTLSERDHETEISYMFLPECWGNGYALESCRAVVKFAFDALGLSEVIAVTQSANEPSRRLLVALGMSPVRTFVEFDAEQVEYRLKR